MKLPYPSKKNSTHIYMSDSASAKFETLTPHSPLNMPEPFAPRFWTERLTERFKPSERVFVVSMGDLFGPWVPRQKIQEIIEHVRKFPETTFLFCTKNPARYLGFCFPPNAILGVTLETTGYPSDFCYSNAPHPHERYLNFAGAPHPRKFVSIEPIMNAAMGIMLSWIVNIKPEIIEVGADNHHKDLPEPTPAEVKRLLTELRKIPGVQVVEKQGMERLLKG